MNARCCFTNTQALAEYYFSCRRRGICKTVGQTSRIKQKHCAYMRSLLVPYVTLLTSQWMWIWMTNDSNSRQSNFHSGKSTAHKNFGFVCFVNIDGHANGNFITYCWPMHTMLSSIWCNYQKCIMQEFCCVFSFPTNDWPNQPLLLFK